MTHPDKGTELFVYELGVDEPFRRQGIASRLLAELTIIAEATGCHGLWVSTEPDNEPAKATYGRAGFDEVETSLTFGRRLPVR